MLRLKHRFTLPKLLAARELGFSKIPVEDDELLAAIESANGHDERWQLTPTPDSDQLEEYWSSVVSDIHADPDWQFVSNED